MLLIKRLAIFMGSSWLLLGCQSTEAPEVPVSVNQPDTEVYTAPAVVEKPEPAPVALTPEQVDDVWQRIRMQLQMPVSKHPKVRERIDWYLQHPNYMQVISDRAAPFLLYIVEQVEARDLPLELALIPLFESDFNIKACSAAHACGLWQLTPLLAKHHGIEIDWWYDGRLDVVQATDAALSFFEYLHGRFDGNWLHALAAYNAGEGRVARAIERNKARGKSTDFFALDLPQETRRYVPKLLAAAALLKHSEDYGMHFPAIANQKALSKVALEYPLDLSLVATLTGISNQQLTALNPGHKRFPAMAKGANHLLIPADKERLFAQQLDNLPPMQNVNWLRYQIQPGDSLSVIAQRYKLDIQDIKFLNQLKSNHIRAGRTLLLPIPAGSSSQTLATNELQYQVQSGDSLWKIARRHGVKTNQLKRWNNLDTDHIAPGKILIIYPQ
ncbi:LysM peptidoglycan-binding domain-containing protein [Bowmanella denitrificans]|uniref:LysM peptidoglycan-binding domain-containing protein n=1 Tax=Bowmanella denitrificans TaxID=366582 RepID=UPI0031CEB273